MKRSRTILISCLILLFSSMLFAGANITIEPGEINFTTKDEFLSGIEIKGTNYG